MKVNKDKLDDDTIYILANFILELTIWQFLKYIYRQELPPSFSKISYIYPSFANISSSTTVIDMKFGT